MEFFKPAESPSPLSHRYRPTTFDDWIGHAGLIEPGKPLRRWIESDQLPSMIFWGPPGCGKTTLAFLIREKTQCRFITLSAVQSGTKDIRLAAEKAEQTWQAQRRKSILFVDEIHRFNKSQQDSLLPYVENGTLTLIGATTENPSFEINAALLSRLKVIQFSPLEDSAIEKIITKVLTKLPNPPSLPAESIEWLSKYAKGDARRALTTLELVVMTADNGEPLPPNRIIEILKQSAAHDSIRYDKKGDEHHQVISAFIKSIRGSDPDAGLYYLARMIEGGEDPKFICRRLIILASEDIGNADPRALQVAVHCMEAVQMIGMPEGRIPLAQAVTYLAAAPKSNAAYLGIDNALSVVRESGPLPVPRHIVNAPTGMMKNLGYGDGYQYSHDEPENSPRQIYLPDGIVGKIFYEPKRSGLEVKIKEKMDRLRSR